jgi:cytochrome c oxidase assembly factor CtaG
LAVLVVDLYSGIAAQADLRLEAHMVEHMVMWLIVAPLLVASAPVRLALFALPRGGRRQLATVLHTRAVTLITGPVGSVALFSVALMVSHIPVVYGAALRNDYVHEAEHALYLITAVIMWAPLVGADPLRNRPGPRGRSLCMLGCMLPMIAIALWLATAATPVYGDYVATAGRAAVDDQRVAAAIMAIASIPAFAIPALARLQRRPLPKRPRIQRAGVPTPTSP